MAQITHGLRAVLSKPIIYDLLQTVMGAKKGRQVFVREFVRAVPGMRILDVGCGTAEILDFLPAGVDYVGYDISPAYINAAKERHGARGIFHCELFDAVAAHRLYPVDLVLILGALHHMDDEVALSLMQLVFAALSPQGRMITIDPCFSEDQSRVARFLISQDRGQNVRNSLGYQSLAQRVFPTVHGTLRHRVWIPYTHWIMECSL